MARRPRVTASQVVTALGAALEALNELSARWGDPDSAECDAEEAALDAAELYARALRRLRELECADKRFDFGSISQAMLEFLPRLVLHTDPGELTELQLAVATAQLHDITGTILTLTRPTPKPLDMAAVAAAEEEEAHDA